MAEQSTASPPPSSSNVPSPPPSLPLTNLRSISSAISSFQNSVISLHPSFTTLKTSIDNLITLSSSQNPKNPIFPSFPQNPLQESSISSSQNPKNPIFTSFSQPPFQESSISSSQNPKVPIFTSFSKPPIQESSFSSSQNPKVPIFTSFSQSPFQATNYLSWKLKSLCETMNSKALKRCLVKNLKEIKLREEVLKALEHAPNPAKLILECCGKFYISGSSAFMKSSHLTTLRQVLILLLECFLVGGGFEIDGSVKEEADCAVMLWVQRMNSEGGVIAQCELDCRGLLLLIGCYGVPKLFRNDDLRDLLIVSNVREMAGILRRSSVLLEIVPEIIEGLMKSKMEVEGVDIAYTFGLEDRFKAQIWPMLISVLNRSREEWKEGKLASQGSEASINEANEKHLAVIKSISKCLDGHKVDALKFLSGWHFKEKLLDLEKDIAEYYKHNKQEKTSDKRKADEVEPGKGTNFQEVKRSRYLGQGPQQHHFVHNSHTGIARHVNGYSTTPSMMHAPVSATDPYAGYYGTGNVINHGVQPVLATDPYAGYYGTGNGINHGVHPVSAIDPYAGVYGPRNGINHGPRPVSEIDPYAGVYGPGNVINRSVHHYGRHGDLTSSERMVPHGYATLPSSSTMPGVVAHNYVAEPSGSTLSKRPVAHCFPTKTSSSSTNNISGPSTSLQSNPVLPTASQVAHVPNQEMTSTTTTCLNPSKEAPSEAG